MVPEETIKVRLGKVFYLWLLESNQNRNKCYDIAESVPSVKEHYEAHD